MDDCSRDQNFRPISEEILAVRSRSATPTGPLWSSQRLCGRFPRQYGLYDRDESCTSMEMSEDQIVGESGVMGALRGPPGDSPPLNVMVAPDLTWVWVYWISATGRYHLSSPEVVEGVSVGSSSRCVIMTVSGCSASCTQL